MAITATYTISLVDSAGTINFTSRAAGFSSNDDYPMGYIGSSTCELSLYNNDGALTPNGGGTYQSTDWFQKALIITCDTSDTSSATVYTSTVFSGVITGFELQDNGLQSLVTISANDFFTKMATSGKVGLPDTVIAGGIDVMFALAFAGSFTNLGYWDANRYALPTFGWLGTAPLYTDKEALFSFTQLNSANDKDYIENYELATTPASYFDYSSITDLISDGIINSCNGIMFPISITFSGAGRPTYTAAFIGSTKTRTAANSTTFTFAHSTSALPVGTLPIQNLDIGFELENIINQVVGISTYQTPVEVESNSSSSQQKYGMRNINRGTTHNTAKNKIMDNDFSADKSETQGTVEDCKSRCTEIVNRKSSNVFAPRTLSFTINQIEDHCPDNVAGAVAYLWKILDSQQFPWQRANITWTGKGATSQTASSMIIGRSIQSTPTDTQITLTLDPYFNNASFILGTSRLSESRVA